MSESANAASGSLWNKNSWHWEEKNHSEWAQTKIMEIIENTQIKDPSNGEVYSFKINDEQKKNFKKGFATISVRKGKKVVCWEFSNFAFEWSSSKALSGSVNVTEFSSEEPHVHENCKVRLKIHMAFAVTPTFIKLKIM
jgi:activator of HSP90 ATPase